MAQFGTGADGPALNPVVALSDRVKKGLKTVMSLTLSFALAASAMPSAPYQRAAAVAVVRVRIVQGVRIKLGEQRVGVTGLRHRKGLVEFE
jgi:hypothetical protein